MTHNIWQKQMEILRQFEKVFMLLFKRGSLQNSFFFHSIVINTFASKIEEIECFHKTRFITWLITF